MYTPLTQRNTSERRVYYSLANFAKDFYEMRHVVVTGSFILLGATDINKNIDTRLVIAIDKSTGITMVYGMHQASISFAQARRL